MSSLKYARKKETMRDCHRLYNKMKIESTCSYEKINLYSYQIYEVFISALPLSLEHMNTHLKRWGCDLFNKMIESLEILHCYSAKAGAVNKHI